MWLHSEAEQSVSTPHLEAHFAGGEGVRTEISTKFTPDSAARAFREARLELLDLYTDDQNLLRPGPRQSRLGDSRQPLKPKT